jgi:hypothetical protein
MPTLRSHWHQWFVLGERALVRAFLALLGLVLIVLGLAMGVSMVMLPIGVAFGLAGVAMLVWGVVAEVPIDN